MGKYGLTLCTMALSVLLVSSSVMALPLVMSDGLDADTLVSIKWTDQYDASYLAKNPFYKDMNGVFQPLLGPVPFANGTTVTIALYIGGVYVENLVFDVVSEAKNRPGVYSQIQLGVTAGQWLSGIQTSGDNKDGFVEGAALPTPEPASVLLLGGTMVVGFGFLRWKMRKGGGSI